MFGRLERMKANDYRLNIVIHHFLLELEKQNFQSIEP